MFTSVHEIRAAASAFAQVYPEPTPASSDRNWIYAEGEYEAAVLDRLVRDGHAATNFAEFAKNYHRPGGTLLLRVGQEHIGTALHTPFPVRADPDVLEDTESGGWRVCGAGEVFVDADGEAATISITGGVDGIAVRVRGEWKAPVLRRGGSAPPHREGEPIVRLSARRCGESLFELPAPALGRPVVTAASVHRIGSGESIAEAQHQGIPEDRTDLVRRADGAWTTAHELAVRYLVIDGDGIEDVSFDARYRSSEANGAFVCSDDRLNRIWATSAFTLRLCMQSLVIDGLKRDRMPWSGDQALNTISNAFTFGDAEIVRDGLIALGRPTHGYVNGIADYSLWWLINARHLVSYLGDVDFARQNADLIQKFTSDLASHAHSDGLFRPADEQDGFVGAGAGSVFIDWGVVNPAGRMSTALQILWCWALRSAAELLEIAGHEGAAQWRDLAKLATAATTARGWDAGADRWTEHLDVGGGASPYANFLAILSGFGDDAPTAAMIDAIRDGATGTPFMRGFALRALGLSGYRSEAIEEIRNRWGGMLDFGSLTFWEEFTAEGESPYEMYGRPFAKSLCHAWASGPASLLPELTVGLRPLDDGWRVFTISPDLGDLTWAAAVVSTRHGDIGVEVRGTRGRVWVPTGTIFQFRGRDFVGPGVIDLEPLLGRAACGNAAENISGESMQIA